MSDIATENRWQEAPFFVEGSVGPNGRTIQIIDEAGDAHTFHVEEALALLECRQMTDRYGDLEINTREFAHAGTMDSSSSYPVD